jgi:hypothetical protein
VSTVGGTAVTPDPKAQKAWCRKREKIRRKMEAHARRKALAGLPYWTEFIYFGDARQVFSCHPGCEPVEGDVYFPSFQFFRDRTSHRAPLLQCFYIQTGQVCVPTKPLK